MCHRTSTITLNFKADIMTLLSDTYWLYGFLTVTISIQHRNPGLSIDSTGKRWKNHKNMK